MTAPPHASALRRVSYAQNGEDILLDRLFGPRTGTYVDIGAHHPVYDSNTCFFYERGWHGVNIEPLPGLHRFFLELRPLDLNLAVAVSDADGELPFYEVPDCSGLSTLSAEIAARHRAAGCRVAEGRVAVRTLARLIREYDIAPPDFLSIDVEGHEERVIVGMPLDRWRPAVLVVESTRPLSTVCCHQAWEPVLLGYGYRLAAFNGINRFYVRADWADQMERLRVPVNVLDNYERLETVLLRRQVADLQSQLRQMQTLLDTKGGRFAGNQPKRE
jgi:FkbM family methyltransferase